MLLCLLAPARGDAIVGRDRLLVPPVLSESRAIYSFVPATLGPQNWASRELNALRAVTRPVAYSDSSTVDVFRDTGVGSDAGITPIDPFGSLSAGGDGGGDSGGMLAGMGGAAFGDAMAAWGLSLADMQVQLPELALTMGSYIDYVNETSFNLIRRLRSLLIGTASLKGTPAMESLGSRGGNATVAGGRIDGGAEDKRKEDLQTTKRVVRSAFKIILGFLLGVLLWMLVSRM